MNAPRPHLPRRASRAFTLIELLTVIAIIGVLAAIIIPTVSKVRHTAANARCIATLREWHRMVMLYANENKNSFTSNNWASTTGPYKPYAQSGSVTGEVFKTLRSCPLRPEDRDAGTTGRVTYVMSRAVVNGAIKDTNPISRVRNPSGYLLFSDSVSSSGAAIDGARSESGLDTYIKPLFTPSTAGTGELYDSANRHKAGPVNAVFLAGNIRRITATPAGSGDTNSIYENRLTWFPDLAR